MNVSSLCNVRILDLNHTNVEDISSLNNVYELNLVGCKRIKSFVGLNNVHKLNLSCMKNLPDISVLSNVHSLTLSYTDVEDVSMLSGVKILKLLYCEKLKNTNKPEKRSRIRFEFYQKYMT